MYIVGLITCKFWERMRSWQKWTSLLASVIKRWGKLDNYV